jgi:hypothetical protein
VTPRYSSTKIQRSNFSFFQVIGVDATSQVR